jgi:hypothetical protein
MPISMLPAQMPIQIEIEVGNVLLTSLETLAKSAGVNKAKFGTLAPAYRESFLSKIKSRSILGIIP